MTRSRCEALASHLTCETILPDFSKAAANDSNWAFATRKVAATNANLNDPAAFGWAGGRVNMQDERRETETKGARVNFTWAHWNVANVHFGGAFDDVSRRITAYDNTQAWQMDSDGEYHPVTPAEGARPASAQQALLEQLARAPEVPAALRITR